MIDEIKFALENVVETIYGFLVLPGNVLLSALTTHFPGLAGSMGIKGETGDPSQVLITSLVLWVLFALLCWFVVRLCKDFARNAIAFFHTLVHRTSQGLGNLKTAVVCKFRGRIPRRRRERTGNEPTLEFDDLDFAILKSVAKLGPGLSLSAPELAAKFKRRPAQVQKSLDKLFRNRMLDSAMGSTNGFDNYRLSDSGAQFIAMWRRQAASI